MSINPTIKTGSSYDLSKFVLGEDLPTGQTVLIPILTTKERVILGNTFLVQDKVSSTLNKNAFSINIGYTVYDSDDGVRYTWNSSIWVPLNTTTASKLTVATPDGQIQTAINVSSSQLPEAGQVLVAVSPTAATWTGSAGGFSSPMTSPGDLIVGATGGAPARLPGVTGSDLSILTSLNNQTDWGKFSDLMISYDIKPSLNYVGEFDHEPTEGELLELWKQNAIYKNSVDGKSYILTGTPLHWVVYLSDGFAFYLTIESTNGTAFKVGQASSTILKCRLFKNGAEITEQTPARWFKWRRLSVIPQPAPYDDDTWNGLYSSGYKQILITIDDIYSRATFFCDIKV